MHTKEAYSQNLQAQLQEFDASIALLGKKVESATDEVKRVSAMELEEINARYLVAAEQIAELAKVSGDAWLKAKADADKIRNNLQIRISQAAAKF